MKGNKVNEVLNRLHLALPNKRDDKVRWSFAGPLWFSGCVAVLGPWVPHVFSRGCRLLNVDTSGLHIEMSVSH